MKTENVRFRSRKTDTLTGFYQKCILEMYVLQIPTVNRLNTTIGISTGNIAIICLYALHFV